MRFQDGKESPRTNAENELRVGLCMGGQNVKITFALCTARADKIRHDMHMKLNPCRTMARVPQRAETEASGGFPWSCMHGNHCTPIALTRKTLSK